MKENFIDDMDEFLELCEAAAQPTELEMSIQIW